MQMSTYALDRRIKALEAEKRQRQELREQIELIDITQSMAECYLPIHKQVLEGTYSIFHLPGGRGSGKSSFVSLELVYGIMQDSTANGIVFRRYASTLRESVFSQVSWAVEQLGVSHLWKGSVSPMQYTYLPTGQQILFRGLDDASKLKSIKPRRGIFKYVWFEEFSELTGANMVRNVLQSVVRGGTDFRIFNSFNPPLSINSWANKYILIPDDRATVFRSNYKMMPSSWLGEAFLLEAERLQEVNEQAYRHEYMGEATGTGGEVFPNVTARTISNEEVSQMQFIHQGIDWGFSVDPLAFIRCSYDRRTQTVYLIDEIVKRGCSNSEIAHELIRRGYDRADGTFTGLYGEQLQERQLTICDSAEPKSVADIQKLGIKAIPCTKYPGSVSYGIRWLQSKHIIIDPKRTPHAYKEFTEYEYETTKDGEFLASVPDMNNHCIDATRYSLDKLINSSKYSA